MKYLREYTEQTYKGLYCTPRVLEDNYIRNLEWYPAEIIETIKQLCQYINEKYSDVMVVQMNPNIEPGLIAKHTADIKQIAEDIHEFLNNNGLPNRVVYGEGMVHDLSNDIHRCQGELLIKIGRKIDSLKSLTGVFEA